MKIALAHSSMTECKTLASLIRSATEHAILWSATTGDKTMEMCRKEKPDLLLLDVNLPEAKGAEYTRQIMSESPCAILVITSAVDKDTPRIFECMKWGALDIAIIPKSKDDAKNYTDFLRKISIMNKITNPEPTPPIVHAQSSFTPLVAIGSSTGGPKALITILGGFPADFDGSIIIIQHIDAEFAPGMAQWLNKHTELEVSIASDGDVPEKGRVLLAIGPDDLTITNRHVLKYVTPGSESPYHPSINTFFESCASNLKNQGIAVLLSGMGKDGVDGMHTMKDSGWYTIAQDEATSVIYGMPKMAAMSGSADDILAVDKIASAILNKIKSKTA